MGDNEQLMQFINWLQQTKFPDASVEQVAQQVQAMSQDPQGQQELQSLVQEFQQSTGMFKKGGKIDQLVEKRKKIRKAKEGTAVPETESKKKANAAKKERLLSWVPGQSESDRELNSTMPRFSAYGRSKSSATKLQS